MKFSRSILLILLFGIFVANYSFAQEESDSISIEELLQQVDEDETEVESDETNEEEINKNEEEEATIVEEALEDFNIPPPPPPAYIQRENVDLGQEDTITVERKELNDATKEKYYNDRAFQYKRKTSAGLQLPDWLNKFFDVFFGGFSKLFGFPLPPWLFPVLKWIFILALIGVLFYAIAKVTGFKINFRPKKKVIPEEISFETIEENLEEVNFDLLLERAIKEKSYRVAVRLFFLKNLQNLTKNDFINWAIDKTNNDYKYELANTNLRKDFEQTVYLFEHIWYGQFELSEVDFQKALNTFRSFQTNIVNEK